MAHEPSAPVAVIDVGSNSIKVLVARRGADGGLETLRARTLDARIGAGISRENPRLSESGIDAALTAIQLLVAESGASGVANPVIVATSAVRDAANREDFRQRVQTATGVTLRILSGDEEAALIGRGLLCDPGLGGLRDFILCDLGGGSLECVAFAGRVIRRKVSLPLGCVRLTERFVPDPAVPVPPSARAAIEAHTRASLAASGFDFTSARAGALIGTGGTVSTARAILAHRAGHDFDSSSPVITLGRLRELRAETAGLPIAERRALPGLPAARADVFPAALATVVALLEHAGAGAVRHSLCNLRHGLAAEALGLD